MSELVVGRKIGDSALATELASIPDVDALLAAASLRSAAGENADPPSQAAVALWEKEAYCRPWTWDVWGRTTLRMMQELRSLGQEALALQLASRFVERCAEGKVSLWMGLYRWGDLVGGCLLPLRTQGKVERFVELLALSPDLAGRMAFSQHKGFDPPLREILEHLGKTQSREEAVGWIQLTSALDLKPEQTRPLAALAREIAPGDLYIENAWVGVAGAEVPFEKKVDVFRRTIAALKAGAYHDRTGGNYGMIYDRLAHLQLENGRWEDAAATCREMLREYPDMDSTYVVNLASALDTRGRKDLAKGLYLLAGRHNAHLNPHAAKRVIESLESLGEEREVFALCVRTLQTWKDGGRSESFERRELGAIRTAFDRVALNVTWEEVFNPFFEEGRPALSKEHAELASAALADLGADEPEKRDRAERILSLLGEAVVPLLRKPALEGGPEERGRARAIVERIYVEEWK
jgi:hypothetical protein